MCDGLNGECVNVDIELNTFDVNFNISSVIQKP